MIYQGHKWGVWHREGSPKLNLKHRLYHTFNKPSGKPLVVLVPSILQPKESRLANLELTPWEEEIENQRAMIRVARRFPEYEFIYRVFPFWTTKMNPVVKEAESTPNLRVFRHGNLPWLMARAEHTFITYYGTPLFEATKTETNIVVLIDKRSVFMPQEMIDHFSKQAIITRTTDEFSKMMYFRLASYLPDDYFSRRMVNP